MRRGSSALIDSNGEPLPSHSTCCHVCKASLNQHPREFLPCREGSCSKIVCRFCFDTKKYDVELWDDADAQRSTWICPPCRGVCPCARCSSRQNAAKNAAADGRVPPGPKAKSTSAAGRPRAQQSSSAGGQRKRAAVPRSFSGNSGSDSGSAVEFVAPVETPQKPVYQHRDLDRRTFRLYLRDSLKDLAARTVVMDATLEEAQIVVTELKRQRLEMDYERERLETLLAEKSLPAPDATEGVALVPGSVDVVGAKRSAAALSEDDSAEGSSNDDSSVSGSSVNSPVVGSTDDLVHMEYRASKRARLEAGTDQRGSDSLMSRLLSTS